MIIESVHVKHFRSILDENLECEQLTALVGANGSGKSSFLRALELFYSQSPKVDKDDYYNQDTSKEIVVSITFKDLNEEKEIFSSYIRDEKLNVERVFSWSDGRVIAKYHGFCLQHSGFNDIRAALEVSGKAKEAKESYQDLRSREDYHSLPAYKNKDEIEPSLRKWEDEHPDKCDWYRDDGQFFGYKEVARGYLGKFTKFLFIPAVRDASDDVAEGRGSVITSLMDLVVRSVLAERDSIKTLREKTQEKYEKIMSPSKIKELDTLAVDMTKTLKGFIPDAEVKLRWQDLDQIDIPMPRADVKLVEDGYLSDVTRAGHGLQRAFILTMLQHLALAQNSEIKSENLAETSKRVTSLPNLVLVIEEPELYQHPNRQRHIAKTLMQLATGSIRGVAKKTQVIYCTHSPLFVGIDRIEQLRILRKDTNIDGYPKITKIYSTNLNNVAEKLWEIEGGKGHKYSGKTLLPRLQAIMTPWMNEGFFADVVVLVEGEDDRAAILGITKALGHEIEGSGFSVIPCQGKTNIGRPYIIFQNLGIHVYILWDGDYDEKKGETEGVCQHCGRPLDKKPDPNENHRLLRLFGREKEDWPEYVEKDFACFKKDLETTLKEEIGIKEFEKYLKECQSSFCITERKHAIKNPYVIAEIIRNAKKNGHTCKTLENIIIKILALKT